MADTRGGVALFLWQRQNQRLASFRPVPRKATVRCTPVLPSLLMCPLPCSYVLFPALAPSAGLCTPLHELTSIARHVQGTRRRVGQVVETLAPQMLEPTGNRLAFLHGC